MATGSPPRCGWPPMSSTIQAGRQASHYPISMNDAEEPAFEVVESDTVWLRFAIRYRFLLSAMIVFFGHRTPKELVSSKCSWLYENIGRFYAKRCDLLYTC